MHTIARISSKFSIYIIFSCSLMFVLHFVNFSKSSIEFGWKLCMLRTKVVWMFYRNIYIFMTMHCILAQIHSNIVRGSYSHLLQWWTFLSIFCYRVNGIANMFLFNLMLPPNCPCDLFLTKKYDTKNQKHLVIILNVWTWICYVNLFIRKVYILNTTGISTLMVYFLIF